MISFDALAGNNALKNSLKHALNERFPQTVLLSGDDPARPLTRLECALLIDAVADPFHAAEVDIYGNYKRK